MFEYIKGISDCISNNPGGFLAIVAALISVLFGFSIYRKNKNREYRRQLFEAVHPELNKLLQTNDDCGNILDDAAFTKHGIAVNNLLAHVGFIEKIRLKRKWQLLAMARIDKNHYIPFYEQYADCGSFDRRQKIRPIVIKRIQDIISFANK